MSTIELASINVNLLVALDALLTEHNVTRAAKRVGISQSAMSHNLATLRGLLGDPLLNRVPTGMEPTPRAAEMAPALRRALVALKAAIQPPPPFSPSTSRRQFRIATPDFIAARLAVKLTESITAAAPNVDVVIAPLDWKHTADLLDDPDVDLVIGPRIHSDVVRQSSLFTDDFVCVVRTGHPTVGDTVSVAEYAALGHVMVSPTGSGSSHVDTLLERHGVARQVVLRVAWFLAAPIIVAQSDLMLTALRTSVQNIAEPLGLRVLPAPFELDSVEVMLSWHLRQEDDPGCQWLRGVVRESVL